MEGRRPQGFHPQAKALTEEKTRLQAGLRAGQRAGQRVGGAFLLSHTWEQVRSDLLQSSLDPKLRHPFPGVVLSRDIRAGSPLSGELKLVVVRNTPVDTLQAPS